MASFKQIAITALFAAAAIGAAAQDKAFSYVPEVHGVIRARWEMNTNSGEQRFRVRNARLTVDGKLHPSISYFLQTEYDNSMVQILDAYGKFDIIKGLYVQGGQFRMPFGVEPFHAPANYIFANRSFMGNQVMNYRAVGAKVGYAIPKTPLTLEFGVFNPYTIRFSGGQKWSKDVAYAGKASLKLPAGFNLSAGYASIKPNDMKLRANLIDGALSWENRNVLVAAEYMFKNYCGGSIKSNHSYVGYVDWHKSVKWGAFNRWSVQGRFDGMTDHWSIETATMQPKRERITLGSTLTCTYKAVHADVRVNYEKYFDYKAGLYSPDQLVLEMVVRF
ncbi:MAG: porin [Muribaculaceae bacterium]|nr:porin [Muribaculaceae bacterium]